MNAVTEWGLEAISSLQQGGDLWARFFAVFTYMGEQDFYLLFLPLLFWSVDRATGVRLLFLYLLSGVLNVDLKAIFEAPRPDDLDPAALLKAYTDPTGSGMPSGHAQLAVTVWGGLAVLAKRRWVWVVAALLALLIGFSRVYLGAHFPDQVVAGWAVGLLVVSAFAMLYMPLDRWMEALPISGQVGLAVGLPALLLIIHVEPETVAATAALMGAGLGLAISCRYLPASGMGRLARRLACYVIGVIVLLGLYFGLSLVFPAEGETLHVPLQFLRYTLLGLWISLGAPWVFQRIGLVPKTQPTPATT